MLLVAATALIRPFSKEALSPEYRLSRSVFLRGLGFVYAVAFLSLARQAPGLIGARGLLPIASFLADARTELGHSALIRLPTLFWLGSSDGALRVCFSLGLVLSLSVLLGYANSIFLGVLWALYSAFVDVGQGFFDQRADLLLLETGFLAIFLANPWRLRSDASSPPIAVVWLLRLLLFRFLLGAGIAHLRGDPCWLGLSCLADQRALESPSILAFYFRTLPLSASKFATFLVLFSELAAPWGFLGPRRVRHVAALIIACTQVAVGLFTTEGFASTLVLLLVVPWLHESLLGRIFPRLASVAAGPAETPSIPRRFVLGSLALTILSLTLHGVGALWSPGASPEESAEPFHLVNAYFAAEPVEVDRREVVFEGTWDDAESGPARWLEYEFPCKPGDPGRRPCFGSPYPHRLDYRLWVAALGDFRREPWTVKLVYELLRENAAVTRLLAADPFKDRPPRFVRALRYRYRFASKRDRSEKPGERIFWHRDLIDEYIRPVSIEDPAIHEYLAQHGWSGR